MLHCIAQIYHGHFRSKRKENTRKNCPPILGGFKVDSAACATSGFIPSKRKERKLTLEFHKAKYFPLNSSKAPLIMKALPALMSENSSLHMEWETFSTYTGCLFWSDPPPCSCRVLRPHFWILSGFRQSSRAALSPLSAAPHHLHLPKPEPRKSTMVIFLTLPSDTCSNSSCGPRDLEE